MAKRFRIFYSCLQNRDLNPAQATRRLIMGPSVITLAVTLLRLAGELRGWSRTFFNPDPGGGGALFGIWLLVPVFGVYFAVKLKNAGKGPESGWKVALRAIISLAVIAGIIELTVSVVSNPIVRMVIIGVVSVGAAVFLMRKIWPALYSTLVSYGLAARISRSGHHVLRDHGQLGDALRRPAPKLP